MSDISYLEYFPSLSEDNHSVTSSGTHRYNCIAWAAESQDRWWWPEERGYWPRNAPRQRTLEAFVEMFKGLGYEECADADLNDGYEKVVIFADAEMKPTHAARQLPDGQWTSKLGSLQDIAHAKVENLNGDAYGAPVRFMQRPRNR